MSGFAGVIRDQAWDRLEEFVRPEAVFEYLQSGERFVGLANIRGQFEGYPGLEPGSTEVADIIGGTVYAMTRTYALITVEGTDERGTAIFRARYPDGTWWWVTNLYELRDGRIRRARVLFAPEFEPPDWRAPFREPTRT